MRSQRELGIDQKRQPHRCWSTSVKACETAPSRSQRKWPRRPRKPRHQRWPARRRAAPPRGSRERPGGFSSPRSSFCTAAMIVRMRMTPGREIEIAEKQTVNRIRQRPASAEQRLEMSPSGPDGRRAGMIRKPTTTPGNARGKVSIAIKYARGESDGSAGRKHSRIRGDDTAGDRGFAAASASKTVLIPGVARFV